MSNKTLNLTPELHRYLLDVSLRETDVLRRLREETATLAMANMQIAPEQGQFMHLLTRLTGARRAVEVGVFTGYSTLCVASALAGDGRLTACDVSEEWTDIARRYWREAGVDERIELCLAPAADTLDALLREEAGHFDLAFIDADKTHYDVYYEKCLALLRPGGLLLIDNVLWNGAVLKTDTADADTQAIQALNRKIHADGRVDVSLLPLADGLTLARKKSED